MAGPLTGIGQQQQQIPLATALQGSQQQNNAQQVRQRNEQQNPAQNTVQGQNTPAGQSQKAETKNPDANILREQLRSLLSADNGQEPISQPSRGSLVDVTV